MLEVISRQLRMDYFLKINFNAFNKVNKIGKKLLYKILLPLSSSLQLPFLIRLLIFIRNFRRI